MMDVTFRPMFLRPFLEVDFEACYALDVVCFAPRFRFSRAMMRRVLFDPKGIVRVACEGGPAPEKKVVGFCAVTLEPAGEGSTAYVATLDVAPDSRGRGIGQALMLAVEQEAARAGAGWLLLHVSVANRAAIRLYEKLGFERGQRERAFYGLGSDAWGYRKRLD